MPFKEIPAFRWWMKLDMLPLRPFTQLIPLWSPMVNLKAYNTDYIAMAGAGELQGLSRLVFALRGSGGTRKALTCALKDAGFYPWLYCRD